MSVAHHRSVFETLATGNTAPKSGAYPDRFDVVLRAMVHEVGAAVLAERSGISRTTLYRLASLADNPSREHVRLAAIDVPRLTHGAQRDDVIEHLARECGGVFVRMPRMVEGAVDLLAHAAALTAEFGEVQRETARALADSIITPAERRVLDAELEDLVQRATALRIAIARPGKSPARVEGRR